MKNRLYDFMSDLDEIVIELMDARNMLELHLEDTHEVNQCVRLRSLLNVQIRMIERITEECMSLHKKMDDTTLDVVHNRIE